MKCWMSLLFCEYPHELMLNFTKCHDRMVWDIRKGFAHGVRRFYLSQGVKEEAAKW
jgi:hypothetical protein